MISTSALVVYAAVSMMALMYALLFSRAVDAATSTARTGTVRLLATRSTLAVGERMTLVALVLDVDDGICLGRHVTWGSTNPNVAIVSAHGEMTALRAGTVIVTATVDGISASVTLSVQGAATVLADRRRPVMA